MDDRSVTKLFGESEESRRLATQILERVTDAFVALDTDWCYTYVNERAAQMFSRDKDYLIGKHIWTEFPEGIDQPFHRAYERAMETQAPIVLEAYYPPYDRWFENRIYPSPSGLTIFFTDVTERRRQLEELLRLDRALRVISSTNRALVHSPDEIQFLQRVCQICVDIGLHQAAWIGFAEGDSDRTIRSVAHALVGTSSFDPATVTWADSEASPGPSATCIRERRVEVVHDSETEGPYASLRENARARGLRSSASLPLQSDTEFYGCLSVYSTDPMAFDKREVDLLVDLAADVAFGIDALRTRGTRDAIAAENARLLSQTLRSSGEHPTST